MHPVRRRKLNLILLVLAILALACGLVLYALRQNISLFYTPTQIASGVVPHQHVIRVGGIVVPGSLRRSTGSLDVHFTLTDYAHTVDIEYQGVLPDLFREGQGIVAQGVLNADASLQASQVLAKHDENYMPPEVKASLQPQLRAKFTS